MFQHWPCRLSLPSSSQQSAGRAGSVSHTHKPHSSRTHPRPPPLVASRCQTQCHNLASSRTCNMPSAAARAALVGRGWVDTSAVYPHTPPLHSAWRHGAGVTWCVMRGVPTHPLPCCSDSQGRNRPSTEGSGQGPRSCSVCCWGTTWSHSGSETRLGSKPSRHCLQLWVV